MPGVVKTSLNRFLPIFVSRFVLVVVGMGGVFFFCSASFDTDLLVIGCGIAGSATALEAARLGMQVTMLSSAPNKDDCNSFWAQGGIIYKAEVSLASMLNHIRYVWRRGYPLMWLHLDSESFRGFGCGA